MPLLLRWWFWRSRRDGRRRRSFGRWCPGGARRRRPPASRPPGSRSTRSAGWPASARPARRDPDSASTMALITAGAAPIVPASPTPLTPSWLVGDGVTVWPSVIDGTSLAAGTRYSASVLVLRLPSRVVDGLLEQRLGEALHDSAVDLAVDDQRVDLDAAVVDGDVLAARRRRPVSVSTSTTHMCVPNGHEKLGGSYVNGGLEVRLVAVGQIVRGERLPGDGGQRDRLVRRPLDGERAAGVVEVVGAGLQAVGGDLARPCRSPCRRPWRSPRRRPAASGIRTCPCRCGAMAVSLCSTSTSSGSMPSFSATIIDHAVSWP